MKNEERPRLTIKPEPFDKIIELIGFLTIIFMISLPLIYILSNRKSKYDWSLSLLPLIGLTVYIGMTILKKSPHLFNYPNKITTENAEFQYKTAVRLIRVLNTLCGILFASMTYAITPNDLKLDMMTKIGIPITVTLMIIIISSYYIYKLIVRK